MEGNNTLKNGRRVDFDLLKIIACFYVLVDHTSYKTLITHFYPELIYKTTTVGYAPLIGPFNNNYAYSMFIILPIFHVYIAYFITGYFIDNFVDYNKKLLVVAIAVAILSVGLSVYLTYTENIRLDKSVGKHVFFMYNNLFLITCSSLSICVFYIGKCIPHIINFSYCQRKVISYFGMLSFGIYLLGDKFIYWYRDVHQVLLSYTPPYRFSTLPTDSIFNMYGYNNGFDKITNF